MPLGVGPELCELLRIPLLGTWVNIGRETLLNRRLCPRRSHPRDGPDAIVVRYRWARGGFGHRIFVAGPARRGIRAVADGTRTYRRGQEEDLWQRIMEALRHRR